MDQYSQLRKAICLAARIAVAIGIRQGRKPCIFLPRTWNSVYHDCMVQEEYRLEIAFGRAASPKIRFDDGIPYVVPFGVSKV